MKFDEIKLAYKKDSVINREDLMQASIDVPYLHHKYLTELYTAKAQLTRVKHTYKVLYKEKWLYYSGKANTDVYKKNPFDLKVMKSDMGLFFDADEDLQKELYKISILEQKIQYTEAVVKEIMNRSFTINNINKSAAFINGVL